MSPLMFVFKYEEQIIKVDHTGLDLIYTITIRKCFEKWSSLKIKLVYEVVLILVLFLFPAAFMAYAYRKISQTLWFAEKKETTGVMALASATATAKPKRAVVHADSVSNDFKSSMIVKKSKNTHSKESVAAKSLPSHSSSRRQERDSSDEDDFRHQSIQNRQQNRPQHPFLNESTGPISIIINGPEDSQPERSGSSGLADKRLLSKDLTKELEYSLLDVSSGGEESDENINDNGGDENNAGTGLAANTANPAQQKRKQVRRKKSSLIQSNSNKAAVNSLMHQLQIYNSVKRPGTFTNRNEQNIHKLIESRKRVVKLVVVLIILFLVSWLPYHVVTLTIDFMMFWETKNHKDIYTSGPTWQTTYIYPVTICLALTNSSLNPVCYMTLSHGFRNMFKASFVKMKNFFCRRK
jgi:hypothetical protein